VETAAITAVGLLVDTISHTTRRTIGRHPACRHRLPGSAGCPLYQWVVAPEYPQWPLKPPYSIRYRPGGGLTVERAQAVVTIITTTATEVVVTRCTTS